MHRLLDPEAQALIEVIDAMGLPPVHTLSVEEARERMRASLVSRASIVKLPGVEEHALPSPVAERRVRLYRPREGTLPVALFLHGGGWTLNDLDTHDDLCRRIAKRSGWLVASLEFRRAPEHKHPAALEDAYFGYRWLLDNAERLGGDPSRRAIVGESSGGATAISLTLMLRDAGGPMPGFLAVVYPPMDRFPRWPSYEEMGRGYTLDTDLLDWFFEQYLPGSRKDLEHYDIDPRYLFPLLAGDLSGMPSTYLMTAEFDPLRDEGRAFVEELRKAGVPVQHRHGEDQMHGFLLQGRAVSRAGALINELADAIAAHDRRPAAAEPVPAGVGQP